jgi:hypothetical protein
MSCPTVVTIQPTECIGNSLNTINANYQSLRTGVCDNQEQINTLRTLLNDLSAIAVQPKGIVLQSLQNTNSSAVNINAVISIGTAPTITSGQEILTQSINIASGTNKVLIRFNAWGTSSSGSPYNKAAATIFRNNTPIHTAGSEQYQNAQRILFNGEFLDTPGAPGTTIYSVRVGLQESGKSVWLNSESNGTLSYGGTSRATLIVQEIKS